MQVTYLGHSCFLITINDKKLLFDPFITPNELAKEIDINQIIPDYILVSHGHEDHVADLIHFAGHSSKPLVIASWEICNWLNNKGITNTHPMNTGGSKELDFGKVKMVDAVHSSSLPDGTYGGNPVGFVIQSNKNCFYFAGDTALTQNMKLIADKFQLDTAFLPIGDNFTMDALDATIAAEYINCSKIIGMHYDTFGFIKIDHQNAKEIFKKANKELILMEIGENLTL